MAVFREMQANGVKPHVVAYSALARPFAYRGDWKTVEDLAREMEAAGTASNEYFLYAQLLAYTSAKQRQPARAEAAFRAAMAKGIAVNDHVLGALQRVMGKQRATALVDELRAKPNSDAGMRSKAPPSVAGATASAHR